MKKILTNYAFDASAGEVTFSDYVAIDLERVLLIVNVTLDNIIIYNFAVTNLGGGAASNVLTVQYDTSEMQDTDQLAIYYDDPDAEQKVSLPAATVTTLTPPAAISGFATETTLGDIKTAAQLIDDTVYAEDVAAQASDKGIAVLAVRRDADTTLVGTDNDYANLQVNAAGQLKTALAKATTSSITSVGGSASNVTLLAANAARLGSSIYNDSSAILYLKLGATASATSFTTKLQPDAYYEVPFNYTGIIDGLWVSATGSARVTEVSA